MSRCRRSSAASASSSWRRRIPRISLRWSRSFCSACASYDCRSVASCTACSSRAAAIAFSCSLRSLATSFVSRSPACAFSSARRRCSVSTSALVGGVDPRQLRLPRALGRGHRLAVLVGERGRLGPVRLLLLARSASPSRPAADRPPSAPATSSCAARFLMASTSSCALRSSTCASSSRALSPFSRSPDFSRSCASSATFSLAATRFRSNPMVLSSRSRRARSSSRILSLWSRIWRSLASSASRRSRMSFSFLLMISRRPRNSRSLEKVADWVNRSRASSISLRSVCRSFSSEWIRASSSMLRASASRARPSSTGAGAPKLSEMIRPLASVETSSKAISSGAGGTSCSAVGHRPTPRRAGRPRPSAPAPASRRSGRRRDRGRSPEGRRPGERAAGTSPGGFSQARFGGRSSSVQRFRRSTMSLLGGAVSGEPASSAANAAWVSGSNFSPSNGASGALSSGRSCCSEVSPALALSATTP